jgi:cation diffusion facilitator CzcD-associated flavoprotein CzcO
LSTIETTAPGDAETGTRPEPDYEVVVIGAGMCGLYAIHLLTQMGINATVLEAADGIGGNWYANRYPGCRFDSESYSYGYSFSPEVLAEWDWQETFAPQPEVLRYIEFVADKLDLRRHVQTDTRVERAVFDPEGHAWTVTVEGGREIRTRHILTAVGLLTIPSVPPFEGRESFRGQSFHTHDWPRHEVDLAGKRVAVIGTGSSGVQVISAIADEVAELTVYQRNPNWCAPLNNSPIDADRMAEIRASYDEVFARCKETPGGFIHGPLTEKALETPEDERLALWEQLYGEPGFGICYANYRDTGMEREANELLSNFVADKIRERVEDPELAEKLIPKDHGFGTKRVILETGYFEVYNRDNVSLVDLRETPIERITPTGIVTADGEREFDVIVYATGYDAVTGAFDRIDFRGVDGRSLREKWADGPVTFLGVQVHGFPNLFTLTGPQSGSGASNFPRGIEEICEWTTALLDWARERSYTWIEAKEEAERGWLEHVRERAGYVLLSETKSWITGYSAGKRPPAPRHLIYLGGVPRYRRFIEAQASEGYPGFEFR